MNASEVAWSSAAAAISRGPTAPRYRTVGRPRTTSSANTNSGTCRTVDGRAKSAPRASKDLHVARLDPRESLSLPCGLSGGLPVGFQIMAAPLAESKLLNVAYALESEIGFDALPAI